MQDFHWYKGIAQGCSVCVCGVCAYIYARGCVNMRMCACAGVPPYLLMRLPGLFVRVFVFWH